MGTRWLQSYTAIQRCIALYSYTHIQRIHLYNAIQHPSDHVLAADRKVRVRVPEVQCQHPHGAGKGRNGSMDTLVVARMSVFYWLASTATQYKSFCSNV